MSAYSDALRKSIREQFGEDAAYQNRIRYASNIGNVEEEPSAISKALGPISETAKSWFNAWGQNVQNAYDNSPMYADFRGAGNAWDADTSYKDPSSYYDNNTFLGSLANAAIGGSAGVVGGIADMVGAEKLGDRAAAVQEATRDNNAITPEFSWEYFTNPHGLARSTGNALGSMATLAPAMAFMPEATALNIAARLGGNKGVQFLIDHGYNYLAKRFAQTLPNAVRWTGTTSGLESLAEGGGTVREAKQLGLDDPYGRGWRTAVANLPGLLASNLAEGLILGGIGKAKPGSSIGRRLATIPASALSEGVQNSLEEGYQQAAQNINLGKPVTEGMNEAMREGFFGSLLLGGLGGAYHAANVNRNIDPESTQEFVNWLSGADATQDYSKYNPITNPARSAERNNDVPIPGDIDYTEADPSDIINDWLNKQAEFNVDMDTDVDVPQGQQESSLPSGNEASGENSIDGFDSRYMQKYESKPGATDLAGVQPKVKSAFNGLAAEYGGGLIVTGGAEKGYHAGGENGHEGGWKLDIDKASVKDPQKFLALCKKYGFAVGDEGDHYDLSAHSKGGVGGTQVVSPDTFISDGGQVSAAPAAGGGNANAWAVRNVFKNAGYNDEAIAGILGRLQQEHNFDTSDVPEHEEEGMHVGGYGMFQWNGGRTTAFLNWAKGSGKDPQNPSVQAEYALKEAQERGITPDRMNKLSAEEAADVWTKEWEVGQPGSERKYAAEWRERIKNGGGGTISTQDFSKLLGNQMIDFAGSEDDTLARNYQQIMEGLSTESKSVLANKYANMFNQDGSFNNTAENRQALAQDEQGAEYIKAAAEQLANQIVMPLLNNNGRVSKQAVKQYFAPQIAGVNMHFLKDAIQKDKLNDAEKVAVLQEADNQLNVPRPQLGDNGQAKFVNDLQKAIDTRDFSKIYALIPTETAKAIANVRPEVQPAIPIVTQEQLDARLNGIQGLTNALNAVATQKWDAGEQQARDAAMDLHEPAKAPTRQMATPEEQARLNALTGQPNAGGIILPNVQNPQEAEANLNALRQSAGVVENQLEAPQVPGVLQSAEDKVAANAANARQWQIQNALRNGDYDLASRLMREDGRDVGADILDSVPHRPYTRQEFDHRLAELQNMPLRQLEQVGQQTLDNMQEAGVPVSEGLAKDLAAGKENAIAHAESKMAEAGVNPTISNQEQVKNVTSQETSEPALKKEESRIVTKFRDDAVDIINQYRDDKITYTEAQAKLEDAAFKAADKVNDENTKAAVWDTFAKSMTFLEGFRQQKEANVQQKPDYSNMSLDELKAERQRLIDDEVERMNRNPGGKGVNPVYTYNDRGEINGRYGKSLNPQWYQDARKELGHTPRKKEYPDIALKNLQKHQEFAELEDAIAQQEKESANNEPSTEKEATENANSNEETTPNEPIEQESAEQGKDYDFGDLDENFADLANSLGITPIEQEKAEPKEKSTTKEKPKKKKRNLGFDDSDEALEAAKKELKEALKKSRSRMNAMPVFDVDVIVPMLKVGAIYVQRGANSFADYAREMISSIGEEVRDWLHPVWKMIESYPEGKKFDESQVIPMFRYVGSYMRNHKQATFDEVKADFAKRAGKENAEKFNDLLMVGYQGAYNCFNGNEEVTDNELNDSSRKNPERDSEGNNQDEVGAVHGNVESDSRGGQGVQPTGKDSRAQRSGSVHGRSTARGGETGDSGVQGSESERGYRNDSAGSKQLTGSRRDSYDGQAVDDGRNAESLGSAQNRSVDGRNTGHKAEAVKVNKNSFKAGNREQIAGSMPFLMPEQVDDVVKADTRLYNNKGEGMMFTNGTGTGKTFTGLGCIKRAVQQGKKNILIIAPSDKVQNDWITAGKGFFGLDISKLDNTTSAGEGIVITSYENVGANNSLVKRDWDMVVADESHKLMQGEKGNRTKALDNVRALTYHANGLRERFERLHAKEYERLAELAGDTQERRLSEAEKKEYENLRAKLMKESEKAIAEWKQIPQEDKAKVLFLSATPFSYVPDIDYAEGYLFNYDRTKDQNGGYNQPNAYDDFLIKHFGYRMRVGKLTKPDADVNNDLMEINFNKWLKEQGVLSGRKLKVTPDYERGYLLVDGGVGKQIDEGMKIALERGVSDSDQKYGKLHSVFENKLKGNRTRYLLEAIKAKEAVGLIKDYVKAGKKVVIFHDFKKNEAENPFVLTNEDFRNIQGDEVDISTARQQYAQFCKDHPELLKLNLDDLQSPIERLTAEFGDTMRIFNGDIPKKKREAAVREFNDDSSKVKVILCQRASAKEGISMHDTTGKHQRALIDLGLATRPTDLIQGEGRIYRTGVVTDAIIRYLNTGTDMEKRAFASTIAGRASTAENLSMGEEARALRNAIVEGFMESLDGDSWKKYLPNSKTEGKGGKERDAKLMDGVTPYEAAKSDYFANQKKNSRNKAQEGIDYFPTPEPIGFKMVEWLGLKPGDRALEPSAGHGAISRYFGAETRNTIVEPSPELATLAKMRLNGGATSKVVEGRFEDLDIHNKYEGIAMNPPYGLGGKTAYEHVAKAFEHLADGGRLIAIVPDGPAANKRLENWLYGDGTKANPGQSNATMLAEIKLPQVAFKRAGTGVATKILIIDKYNDSNDFAEMERRQIEGGIDNLDLTGITDVKELFDKLEYVRTPERVGSDIPRHFTNSTNKRGNTQYQYISLPDETELLTNDKLRQLAGNYRGYTNRKGGWFEFRNENDRAKFNKAANKYLAGQEVLAAEQQEIVDEVLTPNETEHFKGGEFTNSDGVAKLQAAIKGNLHRDIYLKVKEIALQNNGSYSKGARGFVFDNAADRDNFLKKAEAFFSEKASYSVAPGKTMTTDELNKLWNDTAKVVSEDKLTAQEKELRSIAQSMGAQLEFVTCSPKIQGKYDPATGISYINRNAAHNSAPWVAWHEMFHWIKRNNETLFNKLVEHIKTKAPFSKAQLDKYREAIGRPDISDEVVIEEMMADAFPDVRKRVPFFRELAKENVSLYKRLVAFVKRVMDNIVSRFRATSMAGRGLDFQQIAEMHNAFCNMVRDIRGADGKPIFKVSKDGYREITDMDGNTTEQILEAYSLAEEENKYSVADKSSDYAPKKKYATMRNNKIEHDKDGNFKIKELLYVIPPHESLRAREERRRREILNIDPALVLDGVNTAWENMISGKAKDHLAERINNGENPADIARGYRYLFNEKFMQETANETDEKKLLLELMFLKGGEAYATRRADGNINGRGNDGFNGAGNQEGQSVVQEGQGQGQYSIAPKHSDNQGAFSVAPVEAPGSMERIKNATKKLLGLQEKLEDNVTDRHTEKQNQKVSLDDTLPLTAMAHSMKYLAGKNEAIKRMYYLGKKCMDEQEHLRNEFRDVIRKINTLVEDDTDRENLQALLWAGDAEGKEYTAEQLKQEGFTDNVVAAYKLVRDNLAKAYQLVNDARMQVKVRNKTLKSSELPEFMKEHFIDGSDIVNTQDIGGGKIVLTYRGAKVYEGRTDIVNDEMMKQLESDENIAITNKEELGEGVYNVTYNERPEPMGKLTGYMPHFFHRFMVYAKTKDEAGNDMRVAIGSAESLVDATKIANEVAKHNPDKEFVIDTHSFEYGDENNGVVVGDLNYQEMTKRLAENTEMSLTEANKFLHDSAGATLKSRHRFFGNMMKRTGVQGFDENMMWALTHYFNSAARYVAMEHFKPDAISWYERFFGDFNAAPETIKSPNKRKTAQVIRQYINDVNGTPREIEKWCNAVVDRIPILGQKLNDTYNGRPALALSSKVSWFNAVTKLGCLSISSPMLNFMQFINVATMLDSVKYAKMGLNKALKPSELDQLILDRSGIMDEINLASDSGGYTQTRDYGGVHKGLSKGKQILDKSMFFFTWCDALMRKAAVLGAYYQGVQEKGMKPDKGQTISAEALDYAREVNSESNFDYSAANTPGMIRMGSVITQQAFQFQKYPIMQFEFFWNHVVHGTNSQRVKFLMPYFLLTGLPGMIPFGELLASMLGLLIPGDDDDFAKKMKAELMRWAGNDGAKQAVVNSLTNGPLAAFTGIDISERAGMQNFFAGRYYGSKPESTPGAIGTLFGGALYSTASGSQTQIRNGNPIEAIKAVSPGLGNWLQAAVGETRTTHHRVGSTYDGMYERILHGMGFRHIDETNTQFINSYLYESKKRQQEDKKFVMDAYLDDPSEENRRELMMWGISDKELKKYSEGREKSNRDRATGDETKKKSKKPKTEAQIRDDELREFMK